MAGYNGNGRPKIEVYGGRHSTFTLHTPDGIRRDLGREAVKAILISYPIRPQIEFHEDGRRFPGAAKQYFRSAISGMPLPEALQKV